MFAYHFAAKYVREENERANFITLNFFNDEQQSVNEKSCESVTKA